MTIQFISHTSQIISGSNNSGNPTPDRMGWTVSGSSSAYLTSFGVGTSINYANPSGANPANFTANANIFTRYSGSGSANDRYTRTVTDNTKISISAAMKLTNAYNQNQTWISLNGSNRISAGLSNKVAAIYIDDVLTQTSSVDVITGQSWFHVELAIDKGTSTITLYINGSSAATATMPSGLTINAAQMDMGLNQFYVQYNYIMVADGSSVPMGACQIESYTKTGNSTLGFTGSDIVNSTPFSNSYYRTSATSGAQDLYTYTNIFPNAVNIGTIKGAMFTVVASSDGATQGTLNQRVVIASTNYDTSISSRLPNTSPVITQTWLPLNPNTGVAWTKANLQALVNGYVVAA